MGFVGEEVQVNKGGEGTEESIPTAKKQKKKMKQRSSQSMFAMDKRWEVCHCYWRKQVETIERLMKHKEETLRLRRLSRHEQQQRIGLSALLIVQQDEWVDENICMFLVHICLWHNRHKLWLKHLHQEDNELVDGQRDRSRLCTDIGHAETLHKPRRKEKRSEAWRKKKMVKSKRRRAQASNKQPGREREKGPGKLLEWQWCRSLT